MNDIQLAKGLGLAGIIAGVVKMAAARRISRGLGAGTPAVVRLLGLRNVVTSIGVLAYPDNPAPVWARAAGDAVELAVLAAALAGTNRNRHRAALAALAIVGAAITDASCAASLQRRGTQALSTARRTRVNRTGAAR